MEVVSMRLVRPVYESLPYFYMATGALAIFIFYLDPVGARAVAAFAIGVILATAGLTLLLRRQDYRALSREYSGETIELPSTLRG
jgi:membrane protein CcdC involved in cytochrome C biogenesis